MTPHAANARAFLRDPQRAAWHDKTLWLVRQKRDAAARAVPEWEQLRQRASDIKDTVLANLDTLDAQFTAAATANGVTVLHARDAAEFNAHILGLIRKHGAKNIVKSKSMLTEECGMNHYLHAHGVEIVDTDLGERIIQLRAETPSHIVLPAIHLKKEEIGETFHEKLGIEKGITDPTRLTRIARAHLREKFLAADIALTGVNFAIAETGTVVVCTNEGNADMGVHSAPVQIHCMGVEKLLPHWEDLGTFTRLLARNATGQPVTTYTSHYGAPKPGGAMYIVIVDNGRRARLSTPHSVSLKCIRCGGCMNTCPVYRRSGGHSYGYLIPGPIGTVLAPCADSCRHASLPLASTLCGSCANVCPVHINLHDQIYQLRQELRAPLWKRAAMRFAGNLFAHPSRYRLATSLARWSVRHLPRPFLYNPLNVWGKSRELPRPPKQSFQQWYAQNRPRNSAPANAKLQRGSSASAENTTTGTTTLPIAKEPHSEILNSSSLILNSSARLAAFRANLEKAGATLITAPTAAEATARLAAEHPDLIDFTQPATAAQYNAATPRETLDKLGTILLPGTLAVAENAAIWLQDKDLPHRLLPFITQHLILRIDAASLLPTMLDAYRKIQFTGAKFGVFISGPSKTADIEQHLVYGAHGPINLTVLLIG